MDKEIEDIVSEIIGNKIIEPYFNMSAGVYCGLFLKKRLALRMAGMLARQEAEIKELLASNIEETEIAQWTLAYPDGEQQVVNYFDTEATTEDKIDRLKFYSKTHMIEKIEELYTATTPIEAEKAYLGFHDKLEFLRGIDNA